jgi:hypothetical protein
VTNLNPARGDQAPYAARPRPRLGGARTGDRYPTCLHQRASLVERRASFDATVDNLLMRYRIQGPLKHDVLQRAIEVVVDRHLALRTVFPDPSPDEAVIAAPDVPLIRAKAPAHDEVLLAARHEPFDTARDVAVRATLHPVADGGFDLVLVVDHLACDGIQSLHLLGTEVGRAYGALALGREPDLPNLPYAFSDFAEEHRRWLTADVRSAILRHWDERLPEGTGVPALPIDVTSGPPRPVMACWVGLPPGTIPTLRRQHRATPFVLGLAGVCAALAEAGQERPGVMSTAINPWPGLEQLIGHFASLVILTPDRPSRSELRDDGFCAWLTSARRETMMATAHADLPFDVVTSAVRPDFSWARLPPYVFYGSRAVTTYPDWAAADVTATATDVPQPAYAVHPGLKWQLVGAGDDWSFRCQYAPTAHRDADVAGLVTYAAQVVAAAAGTTGPGEPRFSGAVGGG